MNAQKLDAQKLRAGNLGAQNLVGRGGFPSCGGAQDMLSVAPLRARPASLARPSSEKEPPPFDRPARLRSATHPRLGARCAPPAPGPALTYCAAASGSPPARARPASLGDTVAGRGSAPRAGSPGANGRVAPRSHDPGARDVRKPRRRPRSPRTRAHAAATRAVRGAGRAWGAGLRSRNGRAHARRAVQPPVNGARGDSSCAVQMGVAACAGALAL
ncbi:hypothetical protein PsYK624_028160 [Phanerochaete sordida]|uniref:Uncharacterized protein n=1 Tax=Phanerochaete sordida TaxID=48140 RepID=A0A9P3G2K3_9APHY|nr:hypothetical protein PsYK624_028160 [Phanerochaete sordida]